MLDRRPLPALPEARAPEAPGGDRWTARARQNPALTSFSTLLLSLALWFSAVDGLDPRAMTDLGLVSILPPVAYLALLVLVAGFTFSLLRPGLPAVFPLSHVLAWIVMVHGTPAFLYGTLRYAWAWKHVGIVDFIQRTGTVDPNVGALDVYHNWPGFFTLSAALNRAGDPLSLAEAARFAPLFFNLLFFLALVPLMRRMTANDRQVALAVWLFFVASWVGQDYFGPQALAYFLYLALMSLVLGAFVTRAPGTAPRHRPGMESAALHRVRSVLRRWRSALQSRLADPPASHDPDLSLRWLYLGRRGRVAVSLAAIAIVAAIIVTHQLTPVTVIVALGGLVVLGYVRPRTLPLLAGVLTVAWLITGAASFVTANTDELSGVGDVSTNVSGTLVDLEVISNGQVIVSTAARGLVALVALLTLHAVLRALREGQAIAVPLTLASAPVVFVALTSYGSEILFRIYLFALPGAAFLIAGALLRRRSYLWKAGLVLTLSLGLIALFMLAYFGKERSHYFTEEEVAVAAYLMESAPPGSLLVEMGRNYPNQFVDYEKFTYVPISREPWETRERIASDPAAELEEWLSAEGYAATYVLITRSQHNEVEMLGSMPAGSGRVIEESLRRSPTFGVLVENRDAVVFKLIGASP